MLNTQFSNMNKQEMRAKMEADMAVWEAKNGAVETTVDQPKAKKVVTKDKSVKKAKSVAKPVTLNPGDKVRNIGYGNEATVVKVQFNRRYGFYVNVRRDNNEGMDNWVFTSFNKVA